MPKTKKHKFVIKVQLTVSKKDAMHGILKRIAASEWSKTNANKS